MKLSAIPAILIGVSACASTAQSDAEEMRSQLAYLIDGLGVPEGATRACTLDTAMDLYLNPTDEQFRVRAVANGEEQPEFTKLMNNGILIQQAGDICAAQAE